MRIGLFGGTLAPIHIGHLRSAEEVWEGLGLDEVWFIPAGCPPHKDPASLTPFSHRMEMVRLAINGVGHFKVLTIEGERPGPSYSVDTLSTLAAGSSSERDFYFVLGSDAFNELSTWKRPRDLVDYANLVVINRDDSQWAKVHRTMAELFPEYEPDTNKKTFAMPGKKRIILHKVTNLAVSATEIRKRRRSGMSVRFLVPEKVLKYMEEHDLYVKHPVSNPDSAAKWKGVSSELAALISDEVLKNKGERVIILDVRGLSSVTDYIIIAHGYSVRHVQGMAENIQRDLKKMGIIPYGVEGEREGNWILLDYGDVILHLFLEPLREFYDLEGLWSEAPRRIVEDKT